MIARSILIVTLAWIGFAALADQETDSSSQTTSPLCDYRSYFHAKVSQRWYSEMVKNNKGDLRYGTVTIRFKVHSDGTISDLSIVEGDYAGLLKTVSLKVLLDSAPFKPFDQALIKEMGLTYVDDMTFMTRRDSNHVMTPAEAEQRVPPPPPD